MAIIGKDGQLSQAYRLLVTVLLLIVLIPTAIFFGSPRHIVQALSACLSIIVLIITFLRNPEHFKSAWFYGLAALLSISYIVGFLALPNFLPRGTPAGTIMWPIALATMIIDIVALRSCAKFFETWWPETDQRRK